MQYPLYYIEVIMELRHSSPGRSFVSILLAIFFPVKLRRLSMKNDNCWQRETIIVSIWQQVKLGLARSNENLFCYGIFIELLFSFISFTE